MNKYTKYCTISQTERAFKLGAPIEWEKIGYKNKPHTIIPTTQQIINWLREEQEIELVISSGEFDVYFDAWYDGHIVASITMDKEDYYEAELAIIDKVLDFLERGEVI